ncbi:Putative uncharacterized protein [Avibacterium paragallinarum JF4211]|nr:Putative uncharacterized protein [Avibacterium paragallinarum JF4211]
MKKIGKAELEWAATYCNEKSSTAKEYANSPSASEVKIPNK